jgi:membrane protease YdiL (CAAX protease family)
MFGDPSSKNANQPMPDELELGNADSSNASTTPAPRLIFWNGWDAWVLLAIAIAGSLFASLMCQIGYLILQGLFHWRPLRSGELATNPYFVLTAQLVLYVLLVGFLFLLITRKYGLDFFPSLRFQKVSTPAVRRFVVLGIALAAVVTLLSALFPSARETPLEKIFGQGRAIYLFALFGIVVAPFTEEMIFRGFLFPIFENLGGRAVAVFWTALIFAGLHVPQLWGSWSAIGLIFFVGIVLSSFRAVTGMLTPSWIIHLTYNSTLVLAVVSAKFFLPLAHSFRR